jgi:hypothetical protein
VTTTQIDRDAATILGILAEGPRGQYMDRNDVARLAGLAPNRVNDAVARLVDSGYAEWIKTMGTAPYDFKEVSITSRGRYEHQRSVSRVDQTAARSEGGRVTLQVPSWNDPNSVREVSLPPAPIGSPYGFTDEDWEAVSERKHESQVLYAVLGHQFTSAHFDTDLLRANIESMLKRAVGVYNATPGKTPLTLDYRALSAGYGEHLFNEIARDIIGSDIAVFETSDLNPNVMLEMGVALTWGVRVLPIKLEGQPKPPSDVSGQTWADYRDNAATFLDSEHERKLLRMIERAVRKKGRGDT